MPETATMELARIGDVWEQGDRVQCGCIGGDRIVGIVVAASVVSAYWHDKNLRDHGHCSGMDSPAALRRRYTRYHRVQVWAPGVEGEI